MVNNQNGSKSLPEDENLITPLKWWQFKKRRHCPHQYLTPIHGDAIIHFGWYRMWCKRCGRLLDGPVSIAYKRQIKEF